MVPAERIVKPAVGIQDLQQVRLRGLQPVELGAIAQRDASRVRQCPLRVLPVRTVQPLLLLPVPAAVAAISGTGELGLYRRTRCRYS
jgi:hypothetical protein